ncbi:MAG: metalloregulator ArsR/SmtB family transcription factor [Planctomycetota bacterium]
MPAPADPYLALSDARRRSLLEAMGSGERSVSDLVGRVGPDQPSVSKSLRVLRDAGLVRVRRDGRRRLYSVNAPAMKNIHDWTKRFERHWDSRLAAIKAAAERAARGGEAPRTPKKEGDRA